MALNTYSFWIASLWTLLILFLSFKSASGFPKITIPNIDKVVHFTFYFVFVILWNYYFFRVRKIAIQKAFFVLIGAIFLGIFVEFGQKYFTTTRQLDVLDLIANSIGALLGFLLSKIVFLQEKKTK